jgi:hypothetical protein
MRFIRVQKEGALNVKASRAYCDMKEQLNKGRHPLLGNGNVNMLFGHQKMSYSHATNSQASIEEMLEMVFSVRSDARLEGSISRVNSFVFRHNIALPKSDNISPTTAVPTSFK